MARDAWSSQMYQLQDISGPYGAGFCVIMLLFMSYFLVPLTVGVLFVQLDRVRELQRHQEKIEAVRIMQSHVRKKLAIKAYKHLKFQHHRKSMHHPMRYGKARPAATPRLGLCSAYSYSPQCKPLVTPSLRAR